MLTLPDRPESAADAREMLRDLVGSSTEAVDDARLLLHELVAAALFEGVESVAARVIVERGRLRLEVAGEAPLTHGRPRRGTPAAQLGRYLISDLSDRCGGDRTSLWCELDGRWSLGEPDLALSTPAQPRAVIPYLARRQERPA